MNVTEEVVKFENGIWKFLQSYGISTILLKITHI